MLEEDHGCFDALTPQFVNQGALLAQTVGVVALHDEHHAGVGAEQCLRFVVEHEVGEEEELHPGAAGGDEHQLFLGEHGVCVVLALPEVGIHEVARPLGSQVSRRQVAPRVVEVWLGASGLRCRYFAVEHGYDDHGHAVATHRPHGVGGPAAGVFVVEAGCRCSGNGRVAGTAHHVFRQFVGHGHFRLGRFAQAHAQRVAYAVGQQCPDAGGTLDASVLALAGLGHAQVEGEVHAFAFHHAAQQADAAHHDLRVGGFDGDDHIAELLFHTHTEKFHAALHDALRRVAVAAHDAVGERAVVHADAQRGVVLAADVEEADKPLFQPCQFGGVFLVGVFQLLELAGGVDVVARVDAHLLHNGGGHVGHVGVEVDIGHERAVVAFAAQGFAQGLQCLGLACALCGEAHVVRSRVEYGAALA